jgi:hypothetical protein
MPPGHVLVCPAQSVKRQVPLFMQRSRQLDPTPQLTSHSFELWQYRSQREASSHVRIVGPALETSPVQELPPEHLITQEPAPVHRRSQVHAELAQV